MHGGAREGSGRKKTDLKKQPITIYLDIEEQDKINGLPLPKYTSFSKKCRYLMELGVEALNNKLAETNGKVKYIDLFSGMGGMRIGFEQALRDNNLEGNCVFSSEIKNSAITAYKENFNEDPTCDITKIDPSSIPDFDFLLGGFPCQAFSQAGLGLGFEDTRGTLFFDIAKILKEKKPKGFILENVEGLVNHDKGKTFKVITNTLTELGYNIESKVLDGKDFGLAQSRKRIYIIGLYGMETQPLEGFTLNYSSLSDVIDYSIEGKKTDFTEKILSHYKMEDLYGKAIKDKRGGKNNIHSWDIELKGKVSDKQKELLDLLLRQRRNKKWADIIGIKWMDGMPLTAEMISTFYSHPNLEEMLDDLIEKGYLVFEHPKQRFGNKRVPDTTLEKGYNIVAGKLSFEFTKILSPYEVTPTIVATDVHKMAVPVNNTLRPLTISEGLRLFGYPEAYTLNNLNETESFDLLGNTVCIPVIRAIGNKLIESYIEEINVPELVTLVTK